jgi:hypothetical protein
MRSWGEMSLALRCSFRSVLALLARTSVAGPLQCSLVYQGPHFVNVRSLGCVIGGLLVGGRGLLFPSPPTCVISGVGRAPSCALACALHAPPHKLF